MIATSFNTNKKKTITEFLTDLIIRELEEDTNQTKLEIE